MLQLSNKRFVPKGLSPGFTLLELVVAIAIFAVLIVGVVSLLGNVFSVNRQQGGLLSDQDQVRKLSFQMMAEIRNAITSNVGAYPLEAVGDQQRYSSTSRRAGGYLSY
jgi:prepilin-type N-terminal cleavage/methylation domain-containing protein